MDHKLRPFNVIAINQVLKNNLTRKTSMRSLDSSHPISSMKSIKAMPLNFDLMHDGLVWDISPPRHFLKL